MARRSRRQRHQAKRPPATTLRLQIDELGRRGDGIAEHEGRRIYVPFTLPGETVEAEVRGERGALTTVDMPAANRVAPPCPHFGRCGGCALQHVAAADYRAWKRGLVTAALAQRGITAPVGDLVEAHGAGRRRVTVHAETRDGAVRVGFMQARRHRLHAIETCPILAPALADVVPMTAALVAAGAPPGPVDVHWTATATGLDCDMRGLGDLRMARRVALADAAQALDLARLSVEGDPVVTRRVPTLRIGTADVTPPAGGFLQATAAGEVHLCRLVAEHVGDSPAVADLYCGIGPFALTLAPAARVSAVDGSAPAIDALDAAVRRTQNLKPVATAVRDLAHDPLLPAELNGFDTVVFDPPRTGAKAQAAALAQSDVSCVVGVSCDPGSFARDAATLLDGGFRLQGVTPVDQFRYAAHVELVGCFRR